MGRAAAVVQPPAADPIVLLNPRITATCEETHRSSRDACCSSTCASRCRGRRGSPWRR
ncbi:hypothetical protein [Streptomyces huasconensis]|uniref:hypothetical protein n=1 Tax=Streptomyces huasconensis TaxID=1854574 RepID=UPI0033EDFD5F